MELNEQSPRNVIKTVILKVYGKADISKSDLRHELYRSAYKSLKNVHNKNKTITNDIRQKHYSDLKILIENIEHESTNVLNSSSYVGTERSLHLEEIFENKSYYSNQLEYIKKNNFPRCYYTLFRIFFVIIIFLFFVLFLFNFLIKNNRQVQNATIELPHTLKADDKLYNSSILKGNTKKSLVYKNYEGIFIESNPLKNPNVLNKIDFVIADSLSKKLNSLKESYLVEVYLQKQTIEDLQLYLLVRGSGRDVIKKIKVSDKNLNQYFIVIDNDVSVAKRDNIIIRLRFESKEKSKVLLEKIKFSKI